MPRSSALCSMASWLERFEVTTLRSKTGWAFAALTRCAQSERWMGIMSRPAARIVDGTPLLS